MYVSEESLEQDTVQLDLGRRLWRQDAAWDSAGWSHLAAAQRPDGAWLAGGAVRWRAGAQGSAVCSSLQYSLHCGGLRAMMAGGVGWWWLRGRCAAYPSHA